jgi:hypothetical protein
MKACEGISYSKSFSLCSCMRRICIAALQRDLLISKAPACQTALLLQFFLDAVAHSLDVVDVNSIFQRMSVTDETAGPAIRVKPIEVTAEKSVFEDVVEKVTTEEESTPSNEGKKPTLTTSILYPSDVSAHRE